MRSAVSALVGALLLLGAGVATAATTHTGPRELVRQTTDEMLSTLKAERKLIEAEPQRLYELVNRIIVPHFDFVAMSRWVLGKHWRTATRAQKLRFVRAFRTLMVRTYATALLDYTDQEIRYLPMREDISSGDVTVRTEVIQPTGQPVAMNFRLHLRPKKGWKVYDIAVDGISLVSNFRTSFATEIKKNGLDALITRLEKRNAGAEA